ncbi:uncharacterized protein [Battus philenor]|uniref:uncharacterized protein n=1 Tax=Battus philenor TaxID=42288 RepID=UPI0035D00FCF
MQLLTVIALTLLGYASTAPTSDGTKKYVITKDVYVDSFVIYTGEYEIVNIIVPLNGLNYGVNADSKYLFFFVEADYESGSRIDKGLYVFKNDEPKKLLENGRDAAAANDEGKEAYIAADDGIYLYDDEKISVEKYGTITDSIIGIAKPSGSDLIYILTEDKVVYKVTEGGERKEKIEEIVAAEQIVVDYNNNLYYVDADNQIYIYKTGEVIKLEGVPKKSIQAKLLKPSLLSDNSLLYIVDGSLYLIKDDEAKLLDYIEISPDTEPSAYGVEPGWMQYYAKDKKIYQYDLLYLELSYFETLLGEIEDLFRALFALLLS